MALRVFKLGEVVDGVVYCTPTKPYRAGDLAAFLTNLSSSDADEVGPEWVLDLIIGEGASAREVRIELAPFLSKQDHEKSEFEPVFVSPNFRSESPFGFVMFYRGCFIVPSRRPATPTEREEAILRAKELVYREGNELTALRAYISNMEAAVEFQRSGPKRDPIPDDAKLVVWARDGGACIRCGAKEKLHFDHVIPVAKGGGNDAVNIQLLCQPCNLRKSDKIAF